MKSNIDYLNGLHDKLARYLGDLLDSGEPLQPGELTAILKFLKDNDITVEVAESQPMQSLVAQFLASEDALETL